MDVGLLGLSILLGILGLGCKFWFIVNEDAFFYLRCYGKDGFFYYIIRMRS